VEFHDPGGECSPATEQYTNLRPGQIREIVSLKLSLVGLAGFENFIHRRSAEACESEPVLPEPWLLIRTFSFSMNLPPTRSDQFQAVDDLILELRNSLGTTVVVVRTS